MLEVALGPYWAPPSAAVLGQHWGAGALRVQPSLVRVGMEGGPERTAPCVLTRACAWRVRAGGAHGGPGLLAVGGVACAPTGVHNEARRCWDRARVGRPQESLGPTAPMGLFLLTCPSVHATCQIEAIYCLIRRSTTRCLLIPCDLQDPFRHSLP